MKTPPRKPVSNALPAWRKLLAVKPLRNHAVLAEEEGAGRLRLTVNRRRSLLTQPPLRWIFRVSPKKTHVLDRLGRQVLEMCDGRRTVEDIIETFAKRHQLTFHEGRVTITTYLASLMERGLVAVAFPREEQPEAAIRSR